MSTPYTGALQGAGPRKALVAFLLCGVSVSLPGALLPAWGYHVGDSLASAALAFLVLALGLVAAIYPAVLLYRRVRLGGALMAGSGLLSLSFLLLAQSAPPMDLTWLRYTGMFCIGLATGILSTAIFRGISPLYRLNPAATLHLASLFFSLGTILTTVLFAFGLEFGSYTLLLTLALLPLCLIPFFSNARMQRSSLGSPLLMVAQEFRSPGAFLLALVLFFQFGSEWAVGGWLAVFAAQRIGISPTGGLLLLTLYWTLLMLLRLAAQRIIPKFKPVTGLLLLLICASFGAALLSSTDNRFGSIWGITMLSAAFSIVYPLLAQQLGQKLSNYHPDFFHGIFALAAIGGLFAPASLGLIADFFGIRMLVAIPFFGSLVVGALVGLLILEKQMDPALQFRSGPRP